MDILLLQVERRSKLEWARKECKSLEEDANIAAAMERAREGRLFPLGVFPGEEATSEEYFADEYDYLRDKTREAYFSVQNGALRIKLIRAQRKVESLYQELIGGEVYTAEQRVAVARSKADSYPWIRAAVASVCCVAGGYYFFNIAGAIGGALVGFFWGQGLVAEARNEANEELRQAQGELERIQADKQEGERKPEVFSAREEESGERDATLDGESAYANVRMRRAS